MNQRVNNVVSAALRVACILMAVGFGLFVIMNGGVENKPCTTPGCQGNDTHVVDKDAFYYSLAACTVLLGLGGSILAACCTATLSGELALCSKSFKLTCNQVLFLPIKPGLCLGWTWPSGCFADSYLHYAFRLLLLTCAPQLCHPCSSASCRRHYQLDFERHLVRLRRSSRQLAPCIRRCRRRELGASQRV